MKQLIKWPPPVAAAVLLLFTPLTTQANHAWENFHWERTANPLQLELGDNLTGIDWPGHLAKANDDWNASTVLDNTLVAGTAKRNCRPDSGNVEICNDAYGYNGWLGIAQIWVDGDHISKALVKVNDSYFSLPAYDDSNWRQSVMCQEIGHVFGLQHQDEDFNNTPLNTCMDYSDPPWPSPDFHDYEMLEAIYNHLDQVSGGEVGGPPHGRGKPSLPPPAMNEIELDGPGQWGKLVAGSRDGRESVYLLDFGAGHRIVTFVTWANGSQ